MSAVVLSCFNVRFVSFDIQGESVEVVKSVLYVHMNSCGVQG